MVEANTIIGIAIIIINLIPILINKPKWLIITGGISVVLAMLLLTGVV